VQMPSALSYSSVISKANLSTKIFSLTLHNFINLRITGCLRIYKSLFLVEDLHWFDREQEVELEILVIWADTSGINSSIQKLGNRTFNCHFFLAENSETKDPEG